MTPEVGQAEYDLVAGREDVVGHVSEAGEGLIETLRGLLVLVTAEG